MAEPEAIRKSKSESTLARNNTLAVENPQEALNALLENDPDDAGTPPILASPAQLSRSSSQSAGSYPQDEDDLPIDKLTWFDILGNLALPQRLEKWQTGLIAQKEKVRKQQERLKSSSLQAKEKVVGEWRKRVPSADERLDKYRQRVKDSVEKLGNHWSETATVTAREKVSFIAGVFNIFISGYLIGAFPERFYYWFTGQLFYYLPLRYYTYQQKGYHYFMADLCYFVNLLMVLSLWVFPQSKRLFLSTYCLAHGNNAIAIALWRNSLVFHSLDKVTSLFVHIMPPMTLHCLVHMTPAETLQKRFPAIYHIKFSTPGSPQHYSLGEMMVWATVPYAVWQLSYHFLITVRRREKIAAGRPTSFTWLRKSYGNTWIGKIVLGIPEVLQEPAFMLIQYLYAILTIIPCPLWFWYRWASALFLTTVFFWSIYNGATYYIDVFGRRFQKELEQLKNDVNKWQSSADAEGLMDPSPDGESATPEGNEGSATVPHDVSGKQNSAATQPDARPRSSGTENFAPTLRAR